jgi:hypothetical protein
MNRSAVVALSERAVDCDATCHMTGFTVMPTLLLCSTARSRSEAVLSVPTLSLSLQSR